MGFEFVNIHKGFVAREGNVHALAEVNFSVKDREFVCIVGPSGCGKTTLLRLAAGLVPPTSGQVVFHDPLLPGKLRSAMVFQDLGLFPWMTVLDNVAFGLEMSGVAKPERYEKAVEFLERVGLAKFVRNYPHQLSGGMRQRVAILRAFLTDPQILLMDEPFGMLDAQTRILMQEELLTIWQERRHAVLYVTHDIDEAIFLADRVLVMSGRPGRLLADIPISFPRPRDRASLIKQTADVHTRIWEMLRDEVAQDLGVSK